MSGKALVTDTMRLKEDQNAKEQEVEGLVSPAVSIISQAENTPLQSATPVNLPTIAIGQEAKIPSSPDLGLDDIIATPTVQHKLSLNEAVNEYRVKQGKSALSVQPQLCEAARHRQRELSNDFSHAGFEAALSGIELSAAAENIWQGDPADIPLVINSWQESEGHRQNLEGDWTYGCGLLVDGRAVFLFLR